MIFSVLQYEWICSINGLTQYKPQLPTWCLVSHVHWQIALPSMLGWLLSTKATLFDECKKAVLPNNLCCPQITLERCCICCSCTERVSCAPNVFRGLAAVGCVVQVCRGSHLFKLSGTLGPALCGLWLWLSLPAGHCRDTHQAGTGWTQDWCTAGHVFMGLQQCTRSILLF